MNMNISQIKRTLDAADVWYSCLLENDEVSMTEVTTIPHLCSEMHRKLFILDTGNIHEAEQAVSDWRLFANVILDTDCTKYLSKLNPVNLILVSKNQIGEVIGLLNEAMRR